MSFSDILGSLRGGGISGVATGVLAGIGKDLLLAIAPEVVPAIEEFVEQRTTPDGWTEDERGHYLIGVLTRVKAKQIGPTYLDRIGDWLIDGEIDKINKRLDELENPKPAPVPAPAPSPAPSPAPGPAPFAYGMELQAPPDKSILKSGNAIYKFDNRAAWIVFETRLSVGVPGMTLIDVIA